MEEKEKKLNIVKVLFVIVLILICAFIIKKVIYDKNDTNKQINIENNNEINVSNQEENIENKEKIDEKEETVETFSNVEENKGYKLNHLENNQSSFGELNVPVFKKSEKNIKLPVLIYHGFFTPMISEADDPYRLMCSADLFEEQVTTLLDKGYTFITLEDIYKYDKGWIGLPEKNVCITMDDGWKGNYTDAFGVLKKYNIPATIFIVEELVGTRDYFTWEQAKEMYDTGLVKIHVHGKKHVSATGYQKESLQNAYNSTHSKIEEILGEKITKIMAYPAGDCSENTIKWLKEAGFEIQVQTKYGTVNKSRNLDLTALGRIRAEKASGKSILSTIENASN